HCITRSYTSSLRLILPPEKSGKIPSLQHLYEGVAYFSSDILPAVEQWLTAFEYFLHHCLPKFPELFGERGQWHKVSRFWGWSRRREAFRNMHFLGGKGEGCEHSLS